VTIATQTITRMTGLTAFRPISRSRNRREAKAQEAKRNIAHYMTMVKAEAQAVRDENLASAQTHRVGAVRSILWTMALMEQALYLESGGRMGDEHATPTSVLRRLPVKGASVSLDD
jgi:hypothetical protein